MSLGGSPTPVRAVAVAQALAGTTLLLRPLAATRLIGGNSPPIWLIRVLGARLIAQAGAEFGRPVPRIALAGMGVDTAHLASMLAVAATSPRYRRAALSSAGLATASALALLWAARRAPRTAQ